MTRRLEGLAAVVTGAASGFGRGIAEAFSREGASTVIADIDGDAAQTVAAALRDGGAKSAAIETDVTDRASLDAAVALCESEFGGLDVMVANAGIGQRPSPIADTGTDILHRQYDVNAVGPFLSCQAAIPALRHSGTPSILITISGIALLPRPQLYGYGMAKAAAMYLMKSLALELAPERIRVNGLFPAIGDTPMIAEFAGGERSKDSDRQFAEALPLGRLITPEDVGHAAVYLSSPEGSAMTGCALPVDAGRCI